MKILILKPSSLGDVVHAIPVLRLLKAHDPGHEIYWWLSSELGELLQGDPDLSGVFLFNRRFWAQPRYWRELFQTLRQMRAHRFDRVIDLQSLARSSAISWLVKGEFSVGLDDWREGAPALYDVAVRRPSPATHAVDWYLEVLQVFGVPVHWDFVWLPARLEAAQRVRARWNPGGARWVIVNPGARWSNKRWPAAHYAEMIRQLACAVPELRFAILGGTSDRELGTAVAQADRERCLDLTGRTSLSEMIEWIRLSELVVTNDTGPMHIAAALGRPIVSLFGPTDPRRTGPYGQIEEAIRIELPCAPCMKARCHYEKPLECLRAITPSMVVAAIQQRLRLE